MADMDALRNAENRAADRFWSVPGKFAAGGQDALDFLRFCIEEHRIAVERRVRAEDLGIVHAPSVFGPAESQPGTTVTSQCHCGVVTGWHDLTPACPVVYYTAGDLGGPTEGAAS